MSTAARQPLAAVARVAEAWATQSSEAPSRILDTGFGAGAHFLALWQHWRSQHLRPRHWHYVGLLTAAQAQQLPLLLDGALGRLLAVSCQDLEPGFQRILLEEGQLALTLGVGDSTTLLQHQEMACDQVLAATPLAGWDKWQMKALARCCHPGAQLLFCGAQLPARQLMSDAGFQGGADPCQAVYAPHWKLRRAASMRPRARPEEDRVAVVGAGLAGASVAHALALRGFPVDVYEAQAHSAAGASGLPVGLVVPHHSADDSPRSRMSRLGTRLMLQHAHRLLRAGLDWQHSGVLERAIESDGLAPEERELLSAPRLAPEADTQAGAGTGVPLQGSEMQGRWHAQAAWIKPARLVEQWLQHAGIALHVQAAVKGLQRAEGAWLLQDAQGQTLGGAQHVVFANAFGCAELVQQGAHGPFGQMQDFARLPGLVERLQALQQRHGTLSGGPMPLVSTAMPGFPVNGHGSFVAHVPAEHVPSWYAGATFHSDDKPLPSDTQEHAANLRKLQALLPDVARQLAQQFANGQVQAWRGTRCVTPDRLPLVGPLQDGPAPTLWLCAGMGARGLSFSALCAELLLAEMCGEPLPLDNRLAKSLSTHRPRRGAAAMPEVSAKA